MPLEEAVPAIAKILLWELGTAAACLAVTRRVRPLPERLALVVGFQVVLTGTVAAVLTFAGLNRPEVYLGVAVPLLLTAKWWRGPAGGGAAAERPARERHTGRWFAASVALALLVVMAMRPVEELDSLGNLHWMMGWFTNQTTPYEFAFHYVPFWELTYLPGLVLTHSDAFPWFQSLKPVALLGLLLWLIAEELEIPRAVRIPLTVALVALPHLWVDPSGVSTIKNDMLAAAGQVMAALVIVRAVRGRLGRHEAVLLALSAVFVSVKFSGPVFLVAGACVCALVCHRWIWVNRRSVVLGVGGCTAVWLLTVGHYYLHNLLGFGNPFYPFEINLGPVHLPGLADLSYSSIMHNLGDARLWRAFFLPNGGLSPAGMLFPIVLAVILLGAAIVVVRGLVRGRRDVVFAVALYELVVWLIYFRSIYSASGFPGDLQFVLNDLNSVRYVEGALLVAELVIVSLLVRSRFPTAAVYLLIAVQGLSRLWISLRRDPDLPLAAAVTLAAGLTVLLVVQRPRWRTAAAGILLVATLACGAWRVDALRDKWLARFQPLYGPLYEAAPQHIYLVISDATSQQPCGHFPLMGRRLQHRVTSGDWEDLPVADPPSYVVWLRTGASQPAPALDGYRVEADVEPGVLYAAQVLRSAL